VTSTNGHLLQSLDEAMAVVDAGLDGLVIAMDGATQEVYGKYRRDGNVEKVRRCAAHVEEAKTRRGSATPVTNLRVVATGENEHEIPRLELLARELGVDLFSYKSVGCLVESEQYGEYQTKDVRERRFEPGGKGSPRQLPRCPYAFRQPTVFWDGTVVGCEFDYGLEVPWGNIHDKPFVEIWRSPEAVGMRRRLRGREGRPDFCGLCPYREKGQERVVLECRDLRGGPQ
jgi:radical SAM protein with 4Fe4S-binding SPASM domain